MIVYFYQVLVAYGQKAVPLEVLYEIIVYLVLIEILSIDKKLGIITVL